MFGGGVRRMSVLGGVGLGVGSVGVGVGGARVIVGVAEGWGDGGISGIGIGSRSVVVAEVVCVDVVCVDGSWADRLSEPPHAITPRAQSKEMGRFMTFSARRDVARRRRPEQVAT